MNSFQKQFNSLLGVVLGAKKLGTPSAPTPSNAPSFTEDPSGVVSNLDNFEPGFRFQATTAGVDPESQKMYEAKQRSMQNLYNRHEALRAVKNARVKEKIVAVEKSKAKSNTPLGAIKSHNVGGNV